MSSFLKIGLVVCLGASSLLVGCGDDDSSGPSDSGLKADGGSLSHLDSGVTSIDSGLADTGTPAGDSGAGDAGTETVYNVTLSAAQEAPPCTSAGASAAGTATVTISADKSTITVHETYSGLSGAVTAGHIHYGATGVSGGVALPFSASLTSPIDQTLTASSYVQVSGAPATFAGFIDSIKAGDAYLNLHTAACPGGEVRGQIQ